MAVKRTKAAPAAIVPAGAQDAALGALVEGRPLADVAGAAGVPVAQLLGWLRTDAAFIAAMNLRRQVEYDQAAARIQALVRDALDTLAETLKDGAVERKHKLQAAALVLKAAGLVELGRPEGDTDPRAVERSHALDELFSSL